jgi:hypothetical protein
VEVEEGVLMAGLMSWERYEDTQPQPTTKRYESLFAYCDSFAGFLPSLLLEVCDFCVAGMFCGAEGVSEFVFLILKCDIMSEKI